MKTRQEEIAELIAETDRKLEEVKRIIRLYKSNFAAMDYEKNIRRRIELERELCRLGDVCHPFFGKAYHKTERKSRDNLFFLQLLTFPQPFDIIVSQEESYEENQKDYKYPYDW